MKSRILGFALLVGLLVSLTGTRAYAQAATGDVWYPQAFKLILGEPGSSAVYLGQSGANEATFSNGSIVISAGVLTETKTVSTVTTGTIRGIYGKMTADYAGTVTSGNPVGVRGEFNLGASTTLGSGVYAYGVQGKVITNAGVVATSAGYVTGVLGQLDVSSGTITSGHVAPLIGNTYGYNAGTSTVLTNLYLEDAGGGVISSQINTFGKATYVLDISTNSHTPEANTTCTPSAVTGTTGGIHVRVDNVERWIPLAATCS
jgi:hypothetical protein